MSSGPPPSLQQITEAVTHLNAGKYFQVAAYVVLIYDHVLTFSEEVERIWKQKILSLLSMPFMTQYGHHRCKRFVAFEGASTVALVAVCELIMILRVYALYGRNRIILGGLMVLWVLQITLSSIAMNLGFPVPLPPGLVGCIFTGSSKLFPAIWVTPLITDSIIFILTIWRTREYLTRSSSTPTINIFLRDGSMYFLVIFMANLMNTLFFFLAPEDLKAVGASFSQLITATMISRLVLNLRSSGRSPGGTFDMYPQNATATMKFMTKAVGNLGGELDTILDNGYYRPREDISLIKTNYRTPVIDIRKNQPA